MAPENQKADLYAEPQIIGIKLTEEFIFCQYTYWVLWNVLYITELQLLVKTEDGPVKPVVFMTVDGGPEENPLYQKSTLSHIFL